MLDCWAIYPSLPVKTAVILSPDDVCNESLYEPLAEEVEEASEWSDRPIKQENLWAFAKDATGKWQQQDPHNKEYRIRHTYPVLIHPQIT